MVVDRAFASMTSKKMQKEAANDDHSQSSLCIWDKQESRVEVFGVKHSKADTFPITNKDENVSTRILVGFSHPPPGDHRGHSILPCFRIRKRFGAGMPDCRMQAARNGKNTQINL